MKNVIVAGVAALAIVGCGSKEEIVEVVETVETVEETSTEVVSEETTVVE